MHISALYSPDSASRTSYNPIFTHHFPHCSSVGYLQSSLNSSGNTAIGPSFQSIGSEGIKLTEIKVTGLAEGATVNGTINIQVLSNDGTVNAKYIYYQNVKNGGNKGKEGWYLNGSTQITVENDVLFAVGQGLWVKGISGAKLQSSGQVLFDDVIKSLPSSGNVMLCNPYPQDITLAKNVKVAGLAEGATINGTINIQVLSNDGTVASKYIYYQNVKNGGNKGKEGWYLNGSTQITEAADVTFPIGQGLWVKGASGASLKFTLGSAE